MRLRHGSNANAIFTAGLAVTDRNGVWLNRATRFATPGGRGGDAAGDTNSGGLHFPARAKRVIFLFMHGAPSHVDTFDYKPLLERDNGKPLPFDKPRVQFAKTGNLLRSPWKFRQYGECGAWVSELFPHVARHVDDLTFVKSMHGSNEAHGGAHAEDPYGK